MTSHKPLVSGLVFSAALAASMSPFVNADPWDFEQRLRERRDELNFHNRPKRPADPVKKAKRKAQKKARMIQRKGRR